MAIKQDDLFDVFVLSQEIFNKGNQHLSDTINRLYDFYIEQRYDEHQKDIQTRAREKYWDLGDTAVVRQMLEDDEE